jgi:hypothetical protein
MILKATLGHIHAEYIYQGYKESLRPVGVYVEISVFVHTTYRKT